MSKALKKRRGLGYDVVGTTKEGISILKPSVRAIHFSARELSRIVDRVYSEMVAEQLAGSKGK